MASIVPDTSVLVKWFVEEPLTDRALAVRESLLTGAVEAVAPAHLPIELATALVRSARRGRIDEADVADALASIRALEIETTDLVGASTEAADLAMAVGVHPADALFIVTAMARDATLVTADRRLVEAARSVGCAARGLHEIGEPGVGV